MAHGSIQDSNPQPKYEDAKADVISHKKRSNLPHGRHKPLEQSESTQKGETGNYEGNRKQKKEYLREKSLKKII